MSETVNDPEGLIGTIGDLTRKGWQIVVRGEKNTFDLPEMPKGLWATCAFQGLTLRDAVTVQSCIDTLHKKKLEYARGVQTK